MDLRGLPMSGLWVWAWMCGCVVAGAQTRGQGCPAANSIPVAVASSASDRDYVELRRRNCVGGCPAYTVRISGDGRVTWTGEKNVVLLGVATAGVDAIAAKGLIQEVVSRGFWGMCAAYQQGGPETPGYVTTLSLGGRTQTVEDRGGVAPGWLRVVDDEIDGLADTHRWRHGEAGVETFGDDRAAMDSVWPKRGVTRLMKVAARGRSGELRDMLADTSLDLNAVDSSGWTAVMYAAQAGTLEALSLLIAARADVTRRSNAGETAMSAAVSSAVDTAPQDRVRVLWTAGVNINAADNCGVTPLMLAVRRADRPALVAAMVKLGADPTKRDADGNTALDYLKAAVKERPALAAFYDGTAKMLQAPASR